MLPWGRSVPRRVTLALAGAAAAIAVVAVGAVVLWGTTFGEPESAYAQVVEPGDYVQVEGVIEEAGEGVVGVDSALGEFDIQVDDETVVLDGDEPVEVSTLKPGDRLLVSGVAGGDRRLRAQTLAVAGETTGPAPRVVKFSRLERLRSALEGRVVTYTVATDGTRGSVVIDAGSAGTFLVQVDGVSAAMLLERASTALGQRVRVVEESGVTSGTFTLEVGEQAPVPTVTTDSPDDRAPVTDRRPPELVSVRGVVTNVEVRAAREGDRILEGLVTVQTPRGAVEVVVRDSTRVLPGNSGLTRGAGLRGEADGHGILVSGGIDKETGRLVADVIVMGAKVERPGRR
jgi:hypothetical protein